MLQSHLRSERRDTAPPKADPERDRLLALAKSNPEAALVRFESFKDKAYAGEILIASLMRWCLAPAQS